MLPFSLCNSAAFNILQYDTIIITIHFRTFKSSQRVISPFPISESPETFMLLSVSKKLLVLGSTYDWNHTNLSFCRSWMFTIVKRRRNGQTKCSSHGLFTSLAHAQLPSHTESSQGCPWTSVWWWCHWPCLGSLLCRLFHQFPSSSVQARFSLCWLCQLSLKPGSKVCSWHNSFLVKPGWVLLVSCQAFSFQGCCSGYSGPLCGTNEHRA